MSGRRSAHGYPARRVLSRGGIFRRRTMVALAAVMVTIAAPFLSIGPASAGIAVTPVPDFPDTVTVGETFGARINLINNSTPPDNLVPLTLSNLTFVPACANSFPDCAGAVDPGVFSLGTVGTGGGACAGNNFTITETAPGSGVYTLTPTTPVVLNAGEICTVDFTVTTRKVPTMDALPGVPGVQTNNVATVTATAPDGRFTRNTGNDTTTVLPGTPSIVTGVVSPPGSPAPAQPASDITVAPNTPFADTATVTGVPGGPTPTGTVTFSYIFDPPGGPVCAGAPVAVGPGTLAPSVPATIPPSAVATSPTVTPAQPGTYHFIATYSGDANYTAVGPTACGAPGENVTVTLRQANLVTAASNNGTVAPGTTVTDFATVTPATPGGPPPTGTVTYTLLGPLAPGDVTCTASPTVAPVGGAPQTVPVGQSSPPYAPTAPGTYNFLATYSGDAVYQPITTPVGCGVAAERFAVALRQADLVTVASTNSQFVAPGTGVTDQATVTPRTAGAPAPTGTVTYTLVGPLAPGDTTCTASPVVAPAGGASQTVPVGSPSPTYNPTAMGTYNFIASYSGDANYAPIPNTGCGEPLERFTVALRTVQLATAASTNSPSVAPGTPVTDQATLTPPAGGPTPTGTVTYSLVGPLAPGDTTCTASPVVAPTGGASQTVPVGSPSPAYAPTAVGTYNFLATYSGDANYAPITTPVGCGDPAERFSIALRPVGLTTTASTNSTNVAPGATVFDTAFFTPPAGGPTPTGTVTYRLVGPLAPGDVTCAGPTVAPVGGASQTVPVGTRSPDYAPTAVGTYNFLATYSGDANYSPITTPVGCGDPNERFTIGRQPVNLATRASTNAPNVAPGTSVTDQAILTPAAGGPTPTGTVTYSLIGPLAAGDTTCTASPVVAPVGGASQTVPVGQPSPAYAPTATGTYNFLATYSGDAFYAPITTPVGCNVPEERFSIIPAPISLTTVASPPVPVGGTITDTATLSGGVNPTGTITFTLFGPDNPTCSGTPIFTSVRPVNGNGNVTSDPFTITQAGTYRWIAFYSGDANNAPAGPTACADPAELTAGTRIRPTLVTVASAGVAGGSVFDTATLSGAGTPVTGTITFQLFDNQTCTGPALFTNVKPVTGNGNIVSDTFVLPGPGTYQFVATYSGDANHERVMTACDDPAERIGAGVAQVSITTLASAGPVPVGTPISDTATIAGGFNPTGTVTFNLFGPDNPTCAGPPIFTSVKPVNGNGVYLSDGFTPNQPGTYQWVVTYSGDARNSSATSACGDPLEATVVVPRPVIVVEKTATPESRPVPGGMFTFNLVVTNTSNVPLRITALVDDVYGDTTAIPGSTCNTAIGTVLAPAPGPGNTYSCSFPGEFRGPSGAQQIDTVTVRAVDQRGNTVTDADDAIVRITPVPPSITTTKVAAPPSLPEPGGTFTFNYSVTNTGPETVTITSIVDDVYGNLNGRGTCAVGARLAPNGGTYACSFTGSFFGDAGARQVDTITTTGRDDRGQQVVSRAQATVTITDVPPSIRIVKSPDPVSRPEPGGSFRFTVTVTNTSFEPITTTSLVDDIYGNLNGRGSCSTGIVLAANGGSYSCAFDGDFRGRAGDSQTDTVTVTAVDDDGTQVSALARATVILTPVAVPPVFRPPPPPIIVQPPPQILVRTGTDLGGPARLAGILLLVGMTLVAASLKFGEGGPGGLIPLPIGPGGGPRPNGGGHWFGNDNWFGGARVQPPRGPLGGLGVGLMEPTPPTPADAEPEADAGPAWDAWVTGREPQVARDAAEPRSVEAQVVEAEAAETQVVEPYVVEATMVVPEVIVPTVVQVRSTSGLDAPALDAANAGPVTPSAPPAGRRRGRRPGGR